MQHSMSGKEGQATPEEIAAARDQLLAKEKSEASDPAKKKAELEQARAEAEKQLPAGVKLLGMAMDDQGLQMHANAQFGFDDVHKLAQLKLKSKKGAGAGEGAPNDNPYESPFDGLKVVDEGKTILVTITGADPKSRLRDIKGQMPSPDMQPQLDAAFKTARFVFRLDAPFEVVTTNATRRDGKTLVWEVKATDAAAQLPDPMMVRFKK